MPGIILIIDHEASLAMPWLFILNARNLKFSLADSAKNALEIIKNFESGNHPCRSQWSGNYRDFDVLKQIKSLKPQSQLIIYSRPDVLEKTMDFFQTDALDYIKKPVSSIELDLCLKKAKKWLAQEEKLEKNSKEIKDLKNAQALFQQLFDEVPCYITVQDKITGSLRQTICLNVISAMKSGNFAIKSINTGQLPARIARLRQHSKTGSVIRLKKS